MTDRDLLAWATYIVLFVMAVVLVVGCPAVLSSLQRIEEKIGGIHVAPDETQEVR